MRIRTRLESTRQVQAQAKLKAQEEKAAEREAAATAAAEKKAGKFRGLWVLRVLRFIRGGDEKGCLSDSCWYGLRIIRIVSAITATPLHIHTHMRARSHTHTSC